MYARAALSLLVSVLLAQPAAAASSGCVRSGFGDPVAGAEVRVYRCESSAMRYERLAAGNPRPLLTSTRSDADGCFTLEREPRPGDEISVVANGFAPFHTRPRGSKGGCFVLQPAAMVTGRVRTAEGEPVAGAVVHWMNTWDGEYWSATTGGDGRYQAPNPAQWAEEVMVFHPQLGLATPEVELQSQYEPGGYTTQVSPSEPGDEETADIVLPEPTWTEGTVLGPDGPVAGARILVAGWLLGHSDDNGHFRVAASEGMLLTAVHERTDATGVSVAQVSTGNRGELMLEEACELHGQVVEQDSGTALASVRLLVVNTEQAERGFVAAREVYSSNDGTYDLGDLPPAKYMVLINESILEEGVASEEADLGSRSSLQLLHQIPLRATVTGRVIDAGGAAVPGAAVIPVPGERFLIAGILSSSVRVGSFSDCSGHFAVSAPETLFGYQLMVYKPGFAPGIAPSLEPDDPGNGDEMSITLVAGPSLSGVVTDPRGAPLACVKVLALGPGYRALGRPQAVYHEMSRDLTSFITTTEQGTFSVPVGSGLWDLTFTHSGFALAVVTDCAAAEDAAPLQVVLEPLQSLQGRVVREDGSPAVGVSVRVYEDAHRIDVPPGSSTDGAGEFILTGLEPGDRLIEVHDEVSGASTHRPATVPGPFLTLTLPTAYTVTGRVVDTDGETLAEAHITAEELGRNGRHQSDISDDEGRFVLRGLQVGRYGVKARVTGYLQDEVPEIELGAAVANDELTIVMARGLQITGTINDESGEPIDRVRVSVFKPENEYDSRGNTTSDESGSFALAGLPAGELDARFSRRGFVPASRHLELEGDLLDMEVVLDRGFQLKGRVEDRSGRPVAGASIDASLPGPEEQSEYARSDDDGRFLLEGMAPGSWKLRADGNGYEPVEVDDLDPARQETVTLVLARRPSGTVIGTVSGVAEPQMVRIYVSGVGSSDGCGGMVSSDGSFQIDDCPAGPVRVAAEVLELLGYSTRKRRKHADLPAGGEVRVDFDMASGCEVRGRLTRSGQPVPGANLVFSAEALEIREVETDAQGRYEVTLVEGSYHLQVHTFMGSTHDRYIDVDGSTVLDIELAGVTVTGQVVDGESGEAVAGVEVTIGPRHGEWSTLDELEVKTGSTGAFLFEDLTPEPHFLQARHPDHVQWRQVLDLGGGEQRGISVVLEKAAGITVSLIDARSGARLSGTVVAHDTDGMLVFEGRAMRAGGTVRLPLQPGRYRISASADGYATHSVEATVPSQEVTIGLTPGGSLLVRSEQQRSRRAKLLMPTGEEYVRCWCNRIAELWLEGTVTNFDNIAAGSYTLVVYEPDATTNGYPVTIIEGQSTELSIQ